LVWARSGHVDAQYNFGLVCLHGEGGPAPPEEGIESLERAAAGDPAGIWHRQQGPVLRSRWPSGDGV